MIYKIVNYVIELKVLLHDDSACSVWESSGFWVHVARQNVKQVYWGYSI